LILSVDGCVGIRDVFITGLSCVGAAGYLLLNTAYTNSIRYIPCHLVCTFDFPAFAITFPCATDIRAQPWIVQLMTVFGIIGQCGTILDAKVFSVRKGAACNLGGMVIFYGM
jgi:hypothetical protein